MATNLAINDDLLNYALKIGGFRSKKDTVNATLLEELIGLFGQIEYDTDYDYKAMRNRK